MKSSDNALDYRKSFSQIHFEVSQVQPHIQLISDTSHNQLEFRTNSHRTVKHTFSTDRSAIIHVFVIRKQQLSKENIARCKLELDLIVYRNASI